MGRSASGMEHSARVTEGCCRELGRPVGGRECRALAMGHCVVELGHCAREGRHCALGGRHGALGMERQAHGLERCALAMGCRGGELGGWEGGADARRRELGVSSVLAGVSSLGRSVPCPSPGVPCRGFCVSCGQPSVPSREGSVSPRSRGVSFRCGSVPSRLGGVSSSRWSVSWRDRRVSWEVAVFAPRLTVSHLPSVADERPVCVPSFAAVACHETRRDGTLHRGTLRDRTARGAFVGASPPAGSGKEGELGDHQPLHQVRGADPQQADRAGRGLGAAQEVAGAVGDAGGVG